MVMAMFLFGQEGARRERAEAERDALLSSERQARGDAERASLLKDEFLATLSHELRTPLASIPGWCSLLRFKRDTPAEVERALDVIERNANVQVRLVDDLLDATRIQAGKLLLDRARVRLDDAVRTAVEISRPAAQAKGVALELTDAVPAVVDGDASRLQQIVINLLSNAVKFTPAHGHVRVAVSVDNSRAILTVTDDGAGIDPAFVPHVFTRFRQADSSTTRLHGGLGLGLAIVASLAELHGGTVRAHRAASKRTCPSRSICRCSSRRCRYWASRARAAVAAPSEPLDAGPDRGRGAGGQVAGLHATKRILGGGALFGGLRHRRHERVVGLGVTSRQLQFDEAVRCDGVHRVATRQVRDLVAAGGQGRLQQDHGAGGGMHGAHASIGTEAVAPGALELDAHPDGLLGEGGRRGGGKNEGEGGNQARHDRRLQR